MKKSEIIQVALIILGVIVIIRTLETFATQTSMIVSSDGGYGQVGYWIFTYVGVIIVMTLIGYFLIKKSKFFSKRLIKTENDDNIILKISRTDIITISVLILSLYLLITGFPSFTGSIAILLTSFFTDFKNFNEILQGQTLYLLQYVLIAIIFINSERFSEWIERKLMK